MAKEIYYLSVKAKKTKPTQKHRPAMWECMLGTVYAMNSKGEIKYFDYKHDEAIAFAELKDDVRVYKAEDYRIYNGATLNKNKLVLWTN